MSAPGPTGEPRTVEEDARALDELRMRTRRVGEHVVIVDGFVELPDRGVKRCGVGGHGHRVLDAIELSADRAAALLQVERRLVEDPEAAATPDARPVGLQEGFLEPPVDRAGRDLDELSSGLGWDGHRSAHHRSTSPVAMLGRLAAVADIAHHRGAKSPSPIRRFLCEPRLSRPS